MTKNLKSKAVRAAIDLTREQLAEKANATRQTINVVEKGDYNLSMNLCIIICRVLGEALNNLFWEK